jgi:hypothetical protein
MRPPVPKNKERKEWLATQEAKVGGSFEPTSLRLVWTK